MTNAVALPGYLAPLRDALVDARKSRQPITTTGIPEPRNDADAYAVQRAVADEFGWFAAAPTAWKVGAASRTATPNAAPLPARGVRASPATFARGSFNRILIEGEVAFRLQSPLAADVRADDAAAVSAAIGEIVVTIEVVDPRFRDFEAASPTLRLADQGLHGALVVGNGIPGAARCRGKRSSRSCGATARWSARRAADIRSATCCSCCRGSRGTRQDSACRLVAAT
jgi:2-keto-4-pentenoate hydratase